MGAAWEVFVCYMLIVCLLLMLIAIRLGKADINKREPPPGMDLQLNNNLLQPASPHVNANALEQNCRHNCGLRLTRGHL